MSVDWNYLPHDPIRFFGLSSGFDRRDLKRAYGSLIREFKPETHPNEFQRIRRAYEQLENQLRYGVQQKTREAQTEAWTAIVAAQQSAATPGPAKIEVTPSSTELAVEDPAGTFQRLKDAPKSPQDYFVLATLSDLLPGKHTGSFFEWLLSGLKRFPDDPGLQQMVREFITTEVDLKQASAVLVTCSKALRGDAFYRLTESLWGRVARESSFAGFSKVLGLCEENLKHKDGAARTTFYLYVLKRAMWRAKPEWSQKVLTFLESNGAQLDPLAEQELEFLSLAVQYIREDRAQLRSAPLRKKLDEMVHSYCVDDWPKAIARVAETQHELARSAHAMIEEFPTDKSEQFFRLVSLCLIVVSDVAEQTGLVFGSASERQAESQSFAAVSDLRESILPIGRKIVWQRNRGYAIPFIALVLMPLILFTGFAGGGVLAMLCLAWIVGTSMAYFMWLKPRVLDPKIEDKIQQLVSRAYQQQWRSRLFRYVQSCGQAPQVALQRLYETAFRLGDGNWIDAVVAHLQQDLALVMFGQAQMFLR